jgi:hypothetical protein
VTNARAEGINTKIQTIKRKAYGFRSLPRFVNAMYFYCAGLRLHPTIIREAPEKRRGVGLGGANDSPINLTLRH